MTRRRLILLTGAGALSTAGQTVRDRGTAVLNPRLVSFVGGRSGSWRVLSAKAVTGEPLAPAERLEVTAGPAVRSEAAWILRGVTSNERYVERAEKDQLATKQVAIGSRPAATRAALIPIRKTAAWWALTQDERRKIFEDRSHHNATGLKYLPEIARRLHHCRDLAEAEPFDFLTWFDYAPEHAQMFEDLVGALRATEEWKYVDREFDLRLARG